MWQYVWQIWDEEISAKYVQLYCLPEGHIDWNKWQLCIVLVRHSTFPLTFEMGYFVSNDSTRNEFKEKGWSYVISRPMWRKWWRHTLPCKNIYMWYVTCVFMHPINFELVFTLETRGGGHNDWFFHMVEKIQLLVWCGDPAHYTHKQAIQFLVAACLQWCQQRLGAVNNQNNSSFCRWCTCVPSLYKEVRLYSQSSKTVAIPERSDWDNEQSESD